MRLAVLFMSRHKASGSSENGQCAADRFPIPAETLRRNIPRGKLRARRLSGTDG